MHFEILVEGQTELTTLEPIMKKIIGEYKKPHTWRIHKHRGIGSLPDDPRQKPNPKDPTLLHNLPSKLRGYGRSLTENDALIVLVDLDKRDCITYKTQLVELLDYCNPVLNCIFRIAIEELESWFLGDLNALLQAYPDAERGILQNYKQDSICDTWELMAEALYPGGITALKKMGEIKCLQEKRKWAKNIAPLMDVDKNNSPSFGVFRDGIKRIITSVRVKQ